MVGKVCVPLGGGAAGWVASFQPWLPHGVLLGTFFMSNQIFNHTFPVRFLKNEVTAATSQVAWMGCNRGGGVSLDSTGIRLNFRPLFDQSLKFFTALAAPSSIFPITASVRGSA